MANPDDNQQPESLSWFSDPDLEKLTDWDIPDVDMSAWAALDPAALDWAEPEPPPPPPHTLHWRKRLRMLRDIGLEAQDNDGPK